MVIGHIARSTQRWTSPTAQASWSRCATSGRGSAGRQRCGGAESVNGFETARVNYFGLQDFVWVAWRNRRCAHSGGSESCHYSFHICGGGSGEKRALRRSGQDHSRGCQGPQRSASGPPLTPPARADPGDRPRGSRPIRADASRACFSVAPDVVSRLDVRTEQSRRRNVSGHLSRRSKPLRA